MKKDLHHHDNENKEDRLPRPKRKLSRFLARKMLYDYVSDYLDKDRRIAVEELIAEDWETKRDLECLQEGIEYANALSLTKISQPLSEEIRHHRNFWGHIKEGRVWQNLPDSVKWTTEAVLISVIATVVAFLIPWQKVTNILPKSSNQVVLVEVEKEQKAQENIQNPNHPHELSDQGEGRLTVPLASSATTPNLTAPTKPTSSLPSTSSPVSIPAVPVSPSSSVAKAPSENIAPNKPAEDEEVDSIGTMGVDGEESQITQSRKPLKGFVYRAFMSLRNLDEGSPKIVTEIKRLGGVKAGQVELGWRKANGSYFHFSLPQSNYEELLKYLKNFSPVRIYKDPHWRVMPTGRIRFILWVEDSKAK